MSKSKTILTKVNFPREALIISKLWEIIFNLFPKVILIAGILFWYEIPLTKGLFYAPFGIGSIILIGTTIGIILAPIAMLYKDISKGIPIFLLFGIFITPVVFPLPHEGIFSQIVYWNPLTPLLVTTRDWLTGVEANLLPEFFSVTFVTLGIFFLSWILFRLTIPYVIERLGN